MPMKSTIFLDMVPYSPVEINCRLGGIYCHMFGVGEQAKQVTGKQQAASNSTKFHDVISHTTEF
jgi:hypothetical protein